ncbi:hypothetical protein D3C75_731870 [compost metagenome]
MRLCICNFVYKAKIAAGYQYDGTADVFCRIIFICPEVSIHNANRLCANDIGKIIVCQLICHHVERIIGIISNRSNRVCYFRLEFARVCIDRTGY